MCCNSFLKVIFIAVKSVALTVTLALLSVPPAVPAISSYQMITPLLRVAERLSPFGKSEPISHTFGVLIVSFFLIFAVGYFDYLDIRSGEGLCVFQRGGYRLVRFACADFDYRRVCGDFGNAERRLGGRGY